MGCAGLRTPANPRGLVAHYYASSALDSGDCQGWGLRGEQCTSEGKAWLSGDVGEV